MFTSFIAWIKGLSTAGKIVLAAVGASTVGAVTVPQSPVPTPTATEVKAEPKITSETITETVPIAFSKRSVETAELDKGTKKVTTAGVKGVKTITYKITKSDGTQVAKEFVKEEITKKPITEITSVGTYVAPTPQPAPRNNCDPNYTPCVPLVYYDLDCRDIGYGVRVTGSDPHRFDRDGDGYGCESY